MAALRVPFCVTRRPMDGVGPSKSFFGMNFMMSIWCRAVASATSVVMGSFADDACADRALGSCCGDAIEAATCARLVPSGNHILGI